MPSPLSYKSYFNLWNFSITYFNSIKKDIFVILRLPVMHFELPHTYYGMIPLVFETPSVLLTVSKVLL